MTHPMTHRAELPYSYYDKEQGKIILKLTTAADITAATVVYGDPFLWKKTTKKDAAGNDIWVWHTNEISMIAQYTDKKSRYWQAAIPPTRARRMKYHFVLTKANGQTIVLDEDGTSPEGGTGHFFFPAIHEVDAPHAPKWASEVCWYQIFPERFANGDAKINPPEMADWDNDMPEHRNFYGGDLRGIIDKLPYLKKLGVTGLYLTPVFESPSTHKYDTTDYFKIDPSFGDTQTLRELVQKAHTAGMKVMLDAVFNHIGGRHTYWQDVLKKQEKSKYKDYFHIKSFPVLPSYDDREAINYETFAHVANMPKWNTENPDARQHLIDAALHWIRECDIDGWRLDVSDEVSFDFWRAMRTAINAVKPDFYLLGEVWHDPSKWVNGGYFDAVMNYRFGYLIRDFFIHGTLAADEFAQRIFARLAMFADVHARQQFNLLDSHDTMRILSQANGDASAMMNAFLFMYMMRGALCIYYGTEVGMTQVCEGDPGARAPMLWDENKQDKTLQDFFKRLLALRKKYNTLVQKASVAYTRNGKISQWELTHGKQKLTLLYNAGKNAVPITGEILLAGAPCNGNQLPAATCAVIKSSET
ncbi:MAG: glycoside hydrolase family 13 protein [Defluviitaleaceae bacterium]|nr:glycoside hydrolase family 13 protein [Defluviitaleaceae bacterium]